LNGIRGFVFDGIDARGRRFSISISSDEEWTIHSSALLDVVQSAASVITWVAASGCQLNSRRGATTDFPENPSRS
jgi:hypothetical protein